MKKHTIKQLKIHTKHKNNKPYPWLNLSRLWLEQAGFHIGQPIQEDHITIKPR